jgi:hypothetical protein
MLTAWPQLGGAGELKLWIGVFGSEAPPPPAFAIFGQAVTPLAAVAWFPIRDLQVGLGNQPANHQAVVRLPSRGPGQAHKVTVTVGAESIERVVFTLPQAVPAKLDGSFNLLLSSCYFQPEDAAGLLGTIVSRLPVRPHMSLLAGDQVYLDLPLFEDLPEDNPALTRALGDKYRRNWLSGQLGVAGLEPVLACAPTLCLPDDHEFWNNYPFAQSQLPGTWHEGGRKLWADAAQALYEDYQQGGAPASAPTFWRLDIEPLKMLLLDTRCHRGGDFDADFGLFTQAAQDALAQWKSDLLAAQAAGQAAVGVLSAGQAIFVDKPGDLARRWADAEYANYCQFGVVERTLDALAAAGVPVVYLTGDVHWSRVAEAEYLPKNRPLLYEVICSPSRLIDSPGSDQKSELVDKLHGLFGERATWPRHSDPATPPDRFGAARQFAPSTVCGRRGDQVALVQFSRSGRGVEMQVSYYAIHPDPAVAAPVSARAVSLLSF